MASKTTPRETLPTCPMCGGTISDAQIVGNWSEIDGGGGFWLSAICKVCKIDFRSDSRSPDWYIVAPKATNLVERLSEDEIARIDKKLLRYKSLGKKWIGFKEKHRESDEYWRFRRDNDEIGIAIVRDGTPIAEFCVLSSI